MLSLCCMETTLSWWSKRDQGITCSDHRGQLCVMISHTHTQLVVLTVIGCSHNLNILHIVEEDTVLNQLKVTDACRRSTLLRFDVLTSSTVCSVVLTLSSFASISTTSVSTSSMPALQREHKATQLITSALQSLPRLCTNQRGFLERRTTNEAENHYSHSRNKIQNSCLGVIHG